VHLAHMAAHLTHTALHVAHRLGMHLTHVLAASPRVVCRELYSRFPFPGISRPTFIIGCGRSGTTILGRSLATHKDVTYLNEPRHLWLSALPQADIWSSRAAARNGRLFLSEADADPRRGRTLGRLFRLETLMSRRPVLVEKLPINSFRLDFIHKVFPDAIFVHIFRNGLEVASSIERESQKGRWFGAGSYKWNQLVDYAKGRDDTRDLPPLCTTYHDMGLLEWRLSTEAIVAFLRRLDETAFLEVNYDEFVSDPAETLLRLQDFIGVDRDARGAAFAAEAVARKSRRLDRAGISEKDRVLGGRLLPFSMDGAKGLTRCRIAPLGGDASGAEEPLRLGPSVEADGPVRPADA
jgi:LPS sulfotransferase NodH